MISVTETASHLFVRQIKERHIFAPMKHFDELSNLSQKLAVASNEKSLRSEPEKETEDYLVRPFIDFIGYNVADADHVKWQYNTAPDGAEPKPVDFALFRELRGEPRPFVLIEVKSFGKRLSKKDVDQLAGYVSRTTARFGILTNGDQCKWYKKLPNELMDDRPFLKHSLMEPSEKEMEWISAISDRTTDRDILERLAWRLALENDIREWLLSTFGDPVNPAIINKAVGLKVPAKDHAVVSEAARAVWASLQIECPPPPTPPPTSSNIHLEIAQEPQLVLGEGEVLTPEKLPRAWRIGTEQWRKTDDASGLVATVLSELLGCDIRRNDEKRLARELNLDSFDSHPRERGYRKVDGFSSVYCNTGVSNSEKRKLLERIAKEVETDPSVGHPITRGKKVECWLPTGGSRSKRKTV